MCKKFFHPASRDNLKRVWMAEQQAEAYKKKQEELRVQYEKEQDLHNNKALLSKESKDKLSVNFMYEPPPGAKKEREKEDNEPEYKFEWQRKYNAPRESYCKGDSEIRDQPFGIQVRNVRCIKCHKWGHINTDKECPLYSQAMSVVMANNNSQVPPAPDALTLVQQMREDGLALKKSALSAQQHLRVPEHEHLMVSEDEEQSEVSFLKSLSKKEKKKLLKKLQRLEKKSKRVDKKKLKRKKHKRKESDSETDTDSDSNRSSNIGNHSNSSNGDSTDSSSSDSTSSDESTSEEQLKRKRKKKRKSERGRSATNEDIKSHRRKHKKRHENEKEDRNKEKEKAKRKKREKDQSENCRKRKRESDADRKGKREDGKKRRHIQD